MEISIGPNMRKQHLKKEEIDFDEEDLVIDESELGSFISSQNSSNCDNGDTIEYKEELTDEKTEEIYGQNPAALDTNGPEHFSQMRSEIMQEIKSEENPPYEHANYSQLDQYSQYPHQYQQPPPPSHGYPETSSSQHFYPGYNQPTDQFQGHPSYDQQPPPHGYIQPPNAYQPVPPHEFNQPAYYPPETNSYQTTQPPPAGANPMLTTISPTPRKQPSSRRRTSVGEDAWISDDGIPQGWKYRLCPGNNKTIVMAPSGKKFDGRKNALAFMRENNYPNEDILAMEASLRYEGWMEHDCLPSGWKYRKGANSGLDYLTSDVKVLTSHLAAQNYIRENYPGEALDNFNYFIQTWNNKSRPTSSVPQQVSSVPHQNKGHTVKVEEWRTDASVPTGWKLKNINGKEILLSPYGTQFTSRRQAFQALVEANYPDEDKANMFDKLACEGFKANELLPFGWIYQKADGDINFLSREGKLITSFKSAADYLVRSRQFTGEEIQKFKMFEKLETLTTIQPTTSIQRSQLVARKSVWDENDQTVPIGWKSRTEGLQKIFLSPQGYELKSRRLALKHMVGVGYSEEEVEQMRQFLYYESWMDDKSLPHLWKMKRSGSNVSFVSREGDLMESQTEAFTYIQRNPQSYTQDDLLRIQYISSMVKKSAEDIKRQSQLQGTLGGRASVKVQSRPQPVVVSRGPLRIQGQGRSRIQPRSIHPKLNSTQGQTRMRIQGRSHSMVQANPQIRVQKIDPSFISDDTVPKGWHHKTEGRIMYVRAPNGTAYRSRRSACQAMINSGQYKNEEIEEMRNCLKHEGWFDSSDIPAGWKIKKRQCGSATLLMGRGGEFFKSSVEGAKFIQQYIQYFTQDDVDKINMLANRTMNPNTGMRRMPLSSGWNENDSTVPSGWKSKKGVGKGVCLQDPNGVIFASRRKALQQLMKNGGNSEDIESIRNSLIHDGWTPGGKLLPPNWFCKVNSSHLYLFISSEGDLLKSKGHAIQHMKKSGIFTFENKALVENYRNPNMKRSANSRAPPTGISSRRNPIRILNPDESWIPADDTLPSGWKVKEIQFGSNKPFNMLLSASGHKFRSRRGALNFMIIENFPQAEIEEIRASLIHDGWTVDPLLPEKWAYKNVKQPMYCNEVGDLLTSHPVAIDYLMNSATYSIADVNNLYKFINKVGGRMSNSDGKPPANGDIKPFDSIGGLKKILECAVNKDELFKTLKEMGWKEQKYLPAGWLYREKKETDKCIFLVSIEGKLFTTYKAAVLFMRSSNYTAEEVESLYNFPDGNPMHVEKRKRRTGDGIKEEKKERVLATDDDWIEDDYTIPNGWKSKFDSNGKKCFLSRDQQVMMSRRAALKMLIKTGAVEEEVEDMRSLLTYDGWKEFALLPHSWRFKKRDAQNLFMTRNGEIIKYHKDVVKHMRNNEEYTSSNEEDFRKFVAEHLQGRRPDLMFPSDNPHSNSYSGSDISLLRKLYIQGDEEESLEKIRTGLLEKGWKTSEYLPQKWLFRERTAKSPHLKIVSEEGIRFSSFKQVFSFMEIDGKYSEKDVELFRKFPHGKIMQAPRDIKPFDSTNSLKQILDNAVNKDHLMQTLEGMGWKEHLYLPSGWVHKEKQETDKCINIISKEGKLFQSYKAAVLFMRSTDLYTNDDIKSLYLFPDGDKMLAKKRENRTGNGVGEEKKIQANDDDWMENDDTVPEGWKTKKDANGRKCVLSPSGQVMISRRNALKSLIRAGATEDKIEEMRSFLSHDGWEEFSLLPQGWRYKKKNLHNFYMTKNGDLLKTHKDALEHIKKDENYTSSTEEDFKKFLEENMPKKGKHSSKLDVSNTSVSADFSASSSLVNTSVSSELSTTSTSLSTSLDGRKSKVYQLQKLYNQGDEENAEIVRFELMMKGWKENQYLPKKWLFKERTSKSPHLKVLSEEGIKLSSIKSIVSFMKSNSKYSDEDVQLFQCFPDGKQKKVVEKEEAEQKISAVESEKIDVDEFAIKKEYPLESNKMNTENVRKFTPKQYGKLSMENNEELNECKKYLKNSQGWMEDDVLLPPMWMFRRKPGCTSFNFLTPKGEQILSTKEANKYLVKNEMEHSIDAKKLKEKLNISKVKEEADDLVDNVYGEEPQKETKLTEIMKRDDNDAKIPMGITLKKVKGIEKEKIKSEKPEQVKKVSPNLKDLKIDATELVEKFKTGNSGLKISISSVKGK